MKKKKVRNLINELRAMIKIESQMIILQHASSVVHLILAD